MRKPKHQKGQKGFGGLRSMLTANPFREVETPLQTLDALVDRIGNNVKKLPTSRCYVVNRDGTVSRM